MNRLLTLALAAAFSAVTFASEPLKIGNKVDNFTVRDLGGNAVDFASLKGDITVVTFVSTKCPISNDYNSRMKKVYEDYAGKGVNFVFINSNSNEPAAEVMEHAKTNGFAFAVYKDPDNMVADRFGASVTPEAYVIDKAGVVRYHGYIDDSRNEARVSKQGLRNALDAVKSGGQPDVAETKAFGCTIKKVKKAS
jgi:cytochrome oxidase Cu insertion factor (SCO1/SenC/PrrC family)